MKILKKAKLFSLLEKASSKYRLILPKEKLWGDMLFEESEPIERLPDNYGVCYNSLKDFFFPQSEVMFGDQTSKINSKIKSSLFFGVRTCDVKALNFQDFFFGREPKDYYYLTKRENSLVISLACNKPAKGCFCLYLKNSPYLKEQDNFDIQFTDLGEEFIVEAGNKKGENFVKGFKGFLTESSSSQLEKKSELHRKCEMCEGNCYDMTVIGKKMSEEDLDELWEELGWRCTNCGGCEFICPTCFCFNIKDLKYNDTLQRIRLWDSCTYKGYSQMAGGANPYYKRSARIKKRFYCKLYHAVRWFGMFACVGCGRCTAVCPVNLEMESLIASLSKGEKYVSLLNAL